MHYKFICTYSCDNNKKEAINFQKSKVACMGQFEGRRGKREI